MAKRKEVCIWVQTPQTVQGTQELGRRMAEARAGYVQSVIDKQQCSAIQKQQLLQGVIENVRKNEKEML